MRIVCAFEDPIHLLQLMQDHFHEHYDRENWMYKVVKVSHKPSNLPVIKLFVYSLLLDGIFI